MFQVVHDYLDKDKTTLQTGIYIPHILRSAPRKNIIKVNYKNRKVRTLKNKPIIIF